MVVTSEIEIPFSPEEVREVFFDFEHWTEIKSALVKDLKRHPGVSGPIEKGEILNADFGFKGEVVVLENTQSKFTWRGEPFYVLSGDHSFFFEPSKTTPGGTTFRHSETPHKLSVVLMKVAPVTKMFEQFSRDFKARVEIVMKEKGKATRGEDMSREH